MPALLDDRLDIIATDHAPHTREEKDKHYLEAPSGLPLVQHSLVMMLEKTKAGELSKERVIEKMCHAPAECFQIKDRGYLDEGKFADIVVVHPNKSWEVSKNNILYKCGWSPLEGKTFTTQVQKTFVNGELVFVGTEYVKQGAGHRLEFDRQS